MNFSTKLFNEMLAKDSLENDFDQDNLCLITGEPLSDNHITLPCQHKFNYIPLYNEIKKQKICFLPNKKSHSYLETQKLRHNQMKCPYCRSIVDGILPPSPDVSMIIYVNFPEKYIHKTFLNKPCQYKFKSGKKKNQLCGAKCYHEFCHVHRKRGNAYKEKNSKLPIIAKLQNKNKGSCQHCMTRGQRKGEWCGKSALYSVETVKYCKTHAVNYGKWPTKSATI